MEESEPRRTLIGASSAPRLKRYAKMRHDAARGRWLIVAPERVFTPDAIAVAVLKLCDGKRTVDEIARELATLYGATRERILEDVIAMLQELADKGVMTA